MMIPVWAVWAGHHPNAFFKSEEDARAYVTQLPPSWDVWTITQHYLAESVTDQIEFDAASEVLDRARLLEEK